MIKTDSFNPVIVDKAVALFAEKFSGSTSVRSWAPGRVEILGNHTDYNDGLVLGVAIDRYTVVVGRPIDGDISLIYSAACDDTDTLVATQPTLDPGPPGAWTRYTRGVIWAMRSQFPRFQAFQAVILGDVPLGAGLSSSASLQVAMALFLNALHNVCISSDHDRLSLAKKLRKAENGFVGVASGLLDFVTVLFGQPGKAVFLDCRSHEVRRLSLGQSPPAIVVMDSCTSRQLADGMYNIRRSECERIVDQFRKLKSVAEVQSLRDITLEELSLNWKHLDPVGRLRARHVLAENQRVLQGVEALENGDLQKLGLMVSRSHASSANDFENSSESLDALVLAAHNSPGCLGAKLSGAGWAGCVVALVQPHLLSEFTASCTSAYRQATGLEAHVYPAEAAGCSDPGE